MKYKLVKFNDGTYALRRFSWLYLEYRFADLNSINDWSVNTVNSHGDWVKGTLSQVQHLAATLDAKQKQLRDRGKIVKFDDLSKEEKELFQ